MRSPGLDCIKRGDVQGLREIVRKDEAALRVVNQDGQTLLILAVVHGNAEAARALVEAGADVNAKDVGGRTALLWAAAEGHAGLLSLFLGIDPSTVGLRTKSGNTPLHRAAAYGQTGAMRRLIDAGADVNCANAEGATPLSRAARWGHADAVALLLEARADPAVADAAGKRPLDWALAKGFHDVAALLKPGVSAAAASAPAGGRAAAAPAPAPAPSKKSGRDARNNDERAEEEEVVEEEEEAAEEEGEDAGDAADADADAADADAADAAEGEWDGVEEEAEGDEYGGDGDGEEAATPMRVEGWMAKQGHIFRNWKNRWFVLEGRSMLYYSKEGATKARGAIHMGDGTDIIIEEKYAKPFCFTIITPRKRFVLQAADENEMAEWLMAIQNNLECVPCDEVDDGDGGGSE